MLLPAWRFSHSSGSPSTPGAQPLIGDYALVGDCASAALISRDGAVDWMCTPRFDSPTVFCRLLDWERGGTFRLGPLGTHQTSREYVEGTNVLTTVHTTARGQARVTDFLSVAGGGPRAPEWWHLGGSRLLRCVEGLSGEVELDIRFHPTFDFARREFHLERTACGVLASAGAHWLALQCPATLEPYDRGGLRGVFRLYSGRRLWLVLEQGEGRPPATFGMSESRAEDELKKTLHFWRRHWDACTYEGPYRAQVRRSGLVLKLLTYEPTGAIVAAPTAGLPQEVGTDRNFDYRYCWIRDSSLSVRALLLLGYRDDASRLLSWMLDTLSKRWDPGDQPLLTCSGEPPPRPQRLRRLRGYRDSSPVNIGFRGQTELDDYGDLLETAALLPELITPRRWRLLRRCADQSARRWRKKDRSIWELSLPRHYLYSKVQCWTAVDRAMRLSEQLGYRGSWRRWERAWRELQQAIVREGYDSSVGAFTQAFDEPQLDAAALTLPLMRFLPAEDPRVVSTTERIQERLAVGPLVYRYLIKDVHPGHGSPFTLCSFWLADNFSLRGEAERARQIVEGVLRHANDLGLLSEEIDANTGELRGNYPQALSHLGLIRSAALIGEAERRREHERAASLASPPG
jgi:GH15 family glucan-1,4-alpha-glucosidase